MVMSLDRDEWFVALTFGVLIDLDHLFAAPRYIADNGWAAILRPSWDDGSGLPWRSLFHYPVGAFVVAPLAIGWRYFVPLVFWGLHVSLDQLQNSTLEYSTPVESAILVVVCSGIVYIGYRRWGELREETGFRLFLNDVSRKIRAVLSGYGRAIRLRLGST